MKKTHPNSIKRQYVKCGDLHILRRSAQWNFPGWGNILSARVYHSPAAALGQSAKEQGCEGSRPSSD